VQNWRETRPGRAREAREETRAPGSGEGRRTLSVPRDIRVGQQGLHVDVDLLQSRHPAERREAVWLPPQSPCTAARSGAEIGMEIFYFPGNGDMFAGPGQP
jgi:hypothetical protein